MISFEEALNTVMGNICTVSSLRVPFTDSLGRVLAEDVYSDIDMPPFDKSAVDGFACKLSDIIAFAEGLNNLPLEVLETIPAGTPPQRMVVPGKCSRIMTGAMVPEGADCIIMVEETTLTNDGKIIYTGRKSASNICFKSEDIRVGDKVLEKGTLIKPQHIAVLASVGAANPLVAEKPRVGILSTGDELVEPSETPTLSKIRNSNAWQLMAQVTNTAGEAKYHGIALDNMDSLTSKLEAALETSDLVILTGGVSMGDFDYVPVVMKNLGLDILFKSVAIQPGRPTVFGRVGNKYIFGLPGNPVSSFVLFEMLVKPFIQGMMGAKPQSQNVLLPMGADYVRKKSTRKSLIPIKIIEGKVVPLEYHGSAHINAYIDAQGIIAIEMGITELKKGEVVYVRQV
jgi:molybdopterin molybdotransferase